MQTLTPDNVHTLSHLVAGGFVLVLAFFVLVGLALWYVNRD